MTPVTAPADKRFLRAHVRPARRRPGWRLALRVARTVVVVALVVVALGRVGDALTRSPMLTIDRITIGGAERLTTREVLTMLDGLRGQNIVRADLEAARRQLKQSPWIADAVLRKRLPASVDVAITERHPVGIGRLGGRLFLIDEQGTVIDEYGPRYADVDLPVIDGLVPSGSSAIDPGRVELAARVLASLAARPDLARRVSQIDVHDPQDAVVLLDADNALLRLGDREFRERLEGYLDLAPTLRERLTAIDYVDLRYGTHVFVGTGEKGGPAAAARGKR